MKLKRVHQQQKVEKHCPTVLHISLYRNITAQRIERKWSHVEQKDCSHNGALLQRTTINWGTVLSDSWQSLSYSVTSTRFFEPLKFIPAFYFAQQQCKRSYPYSTIVWFRLPHHKMLGLWSHTYVTFTIQMDGINAWFLSDDTPAFGLLVRLQTG